AIVDVDSVSSRIYSAELLTGHVAELSRRISLYSGEILHKVKHVSCLRRKVAKTVLLQNGAYRIRSRGKDSVRRDRHFDIRAGGRSNLQSEIESHLLGATELDVREGLSLEPGKFGCDLIGARLQSRKVVGAGLVRNDGIHDAGAGICCR